MSDAPDPDRVDALARQAAARPPDERSAFLQKVCSTPEMRDAVWDRLDELASSAPDESQTQGTDAEETTVSGTGEDGALAVGQTPKRVGPWRLRSELGRGSMGTVYLAERDEEDFQQHAALKLIRHDLGEEAQERFRAERQILAQLQHPNIAHLLDGGVTDPESGPGQAGRPYFAMEYVDGVPLDRYCNENGLGVEARLRLFQQVCAAVSFSHRNLIVHRDLKPSNVLVTEPDSGTTTGTGTENGGQVKLLDFGIAKVLEGAEAGAALTRTGERPMTPLYAAPEQVEGAPVTTATDVYTLGVVLNELLTGALPYPVRWKSVAEVAQVISNSDPNPPSEQVAGEDEQSFADSHGLSAQALRRKLKGDLDMIVQKALRKEPGRRYTSAAELGQDIERYLDDRPVEARPVTTGYRLRRFVARNRTTVLSAAVAVFALVVGLGVAVWQAQVAATERDRARAAQAEAEEAVTFLTSLFENATPGEAKGDTLTVFDLVDRGRDRLSTLSDQPALQARMFDVVGEVHEELSDYNTADSLLRRSVQLQRAQPSPNRERLGEYLSERASVQWKLGQYAAADSLARRALQQMRAGAATDTEEYAEALSLRANIALSQKQLATADSLFQVTAEQYRSLHASSDSSAANEYSAALADISNNRASIHYYRGNHARAERLYRKTLQTYRRTRGPDHPAVLTTHSAIGLMLQNQGRLEKAATHLDTAITRGTRVLGPRHAQMATYYSNLADVRKAQERYAAADSLYRLTLAVDTTQRSPYHPYVADDWQSIGAVNRAWNRPKRALAAFSQEASVRRRHEPSVDLARALLAQGTLLRQLERYAAAEERLREARTVHRQVDTPDSALTADLRAALATLYAEQGQDNVARRWRKRADSLSTEASSADGP